MTESPGRRNISRLILSILFVGIGVLHFVKAEFFIRIMPPYIPYHTALVYLSGIFEILGGIGVQVKATRLFAGYGLVLLLVAVFPANIHMALNAENFPELPAALLWGRLFLQPLIMLWVWSCSIKKHD